MLLDEMPSPSDHPIASEPTEGSPVAGVTREAARLRELALWYRVFAERAGNPTISVSRLGTDALAGIALVFPLYMMMQMLSAGAMGGGISSAIARALGGGRRADADALVLHAIVINLAAGIACSVLVLVFGPAIYRAM